MPLLHEQNAPAATVNTSSLDLTVIILTLNEEANLQHALTSVCGWARKVHVVDSGSTDRTTAIASQFACDVTCRAFESHSSQRNFALRQLGISTEWILFLDADEWVSDALKEEISHRLASNPAENGFCVKYRLLWMGRWIRRGYYPCWVLRVVRAGTAFCGERKLNEHLVIDGTVGYLENDLIHEDRKGVTAWIDKHNRYATVEAELLIDRRVPTGDLRETMFGSQAERKRWIRSRIWNRLPPILRPFCYFGYRYILRGGFLDGASGLTFHFLQGLWYPLLIDIKYLEMRRARRLTRQAT